MAKNRRTIVSWILAVIFALLFLLAGAGKLTGAATEMFAAWGYPAWFATLIGVLEVLGALGLLVPRTRKWAALGLVGIMLGAAYTHLAHGEGAQVSRPAVFLVGLAAIWWLGGDKPAA